MLGPSAERVRWRAVLAQLAHYFPGLDWRRLTYREAIGYVNRIPDVIGLARCEPDAGDTLEADYWRQKYEF